MTAVAVMVMTLCSALLVMRPRSAPTRSATVRPGLTTIRSVLGGSRRDDQDMHDDAATALRQLSALLQSGRSEPQAWAELRDHWQHRRGGAHALTIVFSSVAASEAAGRGAVEGLHRGHQNLLERAVQGGTASDETTIAAVGVSRGPGASPARRAKVVSGALQALPAPARLRAAFGGSRGQETRIVERIIDRLIAITALSERTGAPLSRLLDRTAAAFDDDAHVRATVGAAVAGPRLTQLILAVLPLGGLVLGQLMGSGGLMFFVTSPWGSLCAAVGLVLLALGYLWSSRMIRRVHDDA